MKRSKRSAIDRRQTIDAYVCISPWLIGFLIFTIMPISFTIYYSFTRWTIMEPPVWIGLKNYIFMFTKDPIFWQSLKVTSLYVVMSLPIIIIFGLLLALLLNLKIRGMNLYRTLFYIPAVISGVSVAMLWTWLLQPDVGMVNTLLDLVGIKGPGWFWDPVWALPSVASMSVWKVGGSAVIYLAGLQNIPPQLYEAARIDGAGRRQAFFKITIPLLTPTLFFQLIIQMIECFKVFTEAFVITKGGPLKATYFYLLYFYEEGFQHFNTGYASALILVLVTVIMGMTVFVNYTSKRWVYYAGEDRAS
ncbi:MAG: sugar ABC transporter permease [Spirochaetia bacterium]|nr:sugar ABC transporter permease [Spirochaetia bacterium]